MYGGVKSNGPVLIGGVGVGIAIGVDVAVGRCGVSVTVGGTGVAVSKVAVSGSGCVSCGDKVDGTSSVTVSGGA